MEQTMGAREAKPDEKVVQAKTWRAIRLLQESQQFITKSCSRCAGLLVNEWCYDLRDDTGELSVEVLRCVQCGQHVDPVILRNRLSPAVVEDSAKRARRSESATVPVFCQAA